MRIQTAVTLLLPFLFYGCFFNLSEQEDFKSWYYGDPGLAGALGEADCDRYADNIRAPRHPYYLHFRTPEVILQPQGGARYPERTTAERRVSRYDPDPAACENVGPGWETIRFDAVDAGIVDTVIPYRSSSVVNDHRTGFGQQSLGYAKGVVYNTGMAAVMKAPVYIVHDILKTLYIPVAGVYYMLKPDSPPVPSAETGASQWPSADNGQQAYERAEPPGSVVQDQMPSPSPAAEINDGRGMAADDDASAAAEAEEEEEESLDLPAEAADNRTAEMAGADASDIVGAPDGLSEEDAAAVSDPGETAMDAAVPGGRTESAPEASLPEDNGTFDDGEGPESAGDPAPAADREGQPAEDASAAEGDAQGRRDNQAEGADTADWPAMPPDEAADSVDDWPVFQDAPGGGIAEEERPYPMPSAAEIIEDDPAPSVTGPAGETPAPAVRASSAPEAVAAETSSSLEPIPWVRLAKRKLRKKVAFIGFFSRAVNVDENTKAFLRERLWPVFKDQCDDSLTLVRQGDPDYPAALNALMRDPFGHLNSFELTTVARFNGLNAIISATIIDIRVSRELGGFLWYKSPEGQLRITILAEVYDAETGTKLLDRIYIREEEVEELEPSAGEKPRGEDQPVLEKALQSIAEDMGDDVCDVLDDQPWRVFVAGIDGRRITLSAGKSAGLKAGNILEVYNSQIIDGLNNQQFFLTGEKVGRIQIIKASGARSEALLIEGQGLRDYSVAMPE